jgi:hypothetical protein
LVSLASKTQDLETELHPMAKATPITKQFQHLVSDLKGELLGRPGAQDAAGLEEVLVKPTASGARASYLQLGWHERCEPEQRRDYRNGCYLRDFVTSGHRPMACLSMRLAPTELSIQSFNVSTWNGATAPSMYLNKPRDITHELHALDNFITKTHTGHSALRSPRTSNVPL